MIRPNLTYPEAISFLFSSLPMYQQVGKIAYKPNLDTAEAFDHYFDYPHRQFKTIHVAGTNGKGSVSHMLASILQSAGYKVGLFTSPHLKDFRERIRINGSMIPEKEVVDFVWKHREKIEGLKPSFFEMTSALAFAYFAHQKVDVAVIEVGMGGRLDATNVIQPLLSVITNIGLDHMEHLGDTLAAIAGEKAGIIKSGVPVVVGEGAPDTVPVFTQRAAGLQSPLFFADRTFTVRQVDMEDGKQCFTLSAMDDLFPFQLRTDLMGHYQRANIVTVMTALRVLRHQSKARRKPLLEIPDHAISEGLDQVMMQTGLRGRWEVIGQKPLIICDTGHNAHGFKESMPQLKAMTCRRLHFVFGVVNDKDLDSILPLMPEDAYYYFTKADLARAMDAHELAKRCTAYGLRGQIVQTVPNAIRIARSNALPEDIIFVGGSNFVVAEALPEDHSR